MMEPIGFIITRHVNSPETNNYWIECYHCIRMFYDYPIVIIDDGSNPEFLTISPDLINCQIIFEKEFTGRGELLPYYYFYKSHFFEKAIIIHDSVFIQQKIDFQMYTGVQFLWEFEHTWNDVTEEIQLLINTVKTRTDIVFHEILQMYYEKQNWKGCYGVQSVIDHSFLSYIQDKYSFFELLHYVKTRKNRMALERIFGFLCHYNQPDLINNAPIFGNIHTYTRNVSTARQLDYDYFYYHYMYDKPNGHIAHSPIVKVWTGR